MIAAAQRWGARVRGAAAGLYALRAGPVLQPIVVETHAHGLTARARIYPTGDIDHRLAVATGCDPRALARAVTQHRDRLAAAAAAQQARLAALLAAPWLLVAPLWAVWLGMEWMVSAPIAAAQFAWVALSTTPWSEWVGAPLVREAAWGLAWSWARPAVEGAVLAWVSRRLVRWAAGWVGRRVMRGAADLE